MEKRKSKIKKLEDMEKDWDVEKNKIKKCAPSARLFILLQICEPVNTLIL